LRIGNRPAEKYILVILVVVVAASAMIRVSGVWFGYPLAVHPDEGRLVRPALKILKTGDLNPHFFDYPSLNIYLQAALYKTVAVVEKTVHGGGMGRIPTIRFYIVGRFLSVVMSLLTIVITFAIGRRLIHPIAGLASAYFVGASLLHILNSFIITVDAPMAFWSSLAVLMAARIATGDGRLYDYVLAGMFVGFAVGSKYTAFLCVIPIVIAHLHASRGAKPRPTWLILLCLVIIPFAFLLTTPFAALDYPAFFEAINSESSHYRGGHFGNEGEGANSFFLYGKSLFLEGLGPVPAILAIVGFGWLLRRKAWCALLLLSFPLLLFLFVGQYRVFFSRNLVAAVPCLAVLSGAGVQFLYETLHRAWFRWRGTLRLAGSLAGGAVVLIVVLGTYGQVSTAREEIRMMTLPDSRWVSLHWIGENIPAGASIGREQYTPPVQKFAKRYRVTNLGYFSLTRRKAVSKIPALDYVVLSSYNFERFLEDAERYPRQAATYEAFFREQRLMKEFVPDGVSLGGPRILIFAIEQ
jgi:4-amino-4-deoxy-L-arabinose transferase-like glycosyltransferase